MPGGRSKCPDGSCIPPRRSTSPSMRWPSPGPAPRCWAVAAAPRRGRGEADPPAQEPPQLAQRLASGKFVLSVEVDPPRGFGIHKLLAGAHLLAEAGADAINVADNPMARMRMSPWAVCQLIQREVGIDSGVHFPTRGRHP